MNVIISVVMLFPQGSGDLKDVCWHSDGRQFMSAHMDGHIYIWDSQSPESAPVLKSLYGIIISNQMMIIIHVFSYRGNETSSHKVNHLARVSAVCE